MRDTKEMQLANELWKDKQVELELVKQRREKQEAEAHRLKVLERYHIQQAEKRGHKVGHTIYSKSTEVSYVLVCEKGKVGDG